MFKKADGSKWKPTKLDYYIHTKMHLEKSLEELEIKFLKNGGHFPTVQNKLVQTHKKKIAEYTRKIELEKMKQK